jgi:predicted Fe-Mo cluster-binding NifX family protein
MRYAIPVSDGKLAPHFGHCEHFAIIDVDEAAKKIVSSKLIASPEHQPVLSHLHGTLETGPNVCDH